LPLGYYFVAIADLETQLGFGKDYIAVTEDFDAFLSDLTLKSLLLGIVGPRWIGPARL